MFYPELEVLRSGAIVRVAEARYAASTVRFVIRFVLYQKRDQDVRVEKYTNCIQWSVHILP